MKVTIKDGLTKDNFWNSCTQKWPQATREFYDWLDAYKEAVEWVELFAARVKFHDLPRAMQMGIWIQFVLDNPFNTLAPRSLKEFELDLEIELYFFKRQAFLNQPT